MARNYSILGQDTNTAATSILGLTSATTIRPRIHYIQAGSDATADNAAEYNLIRYTAAGTSTGVTPTALDPADPASLASAGQAHTVEPTYTAGAIVLGIFKHQRSTFQFWSSPGRELVLPATASNGVGVQSITVGGSAYNEGVVIHYEE